MARLRSTWIYRKVDDIPSFRDLNKIWIGLVSIVTLVTLTALATVAGQIGILKSQYSMSGVFTDTGGLRSGMDVKVAGVTSGKVTGVHPDFRTGQVIITWKVDSGVNLGPQTKAEIVVANFLGGLHIRLSGPVKRPYVHEQTEADRRIPLQRTRTPFSVIDALGETVRNAQELDIDAVNKVVATFADATERSGDAFGALVTNVSKVTAAVGQREAELRRLLTNSQQVTTSLRVKDAELLQLVDAADLLLTRLDERRSELSTVLGSSSRVVTQLADLVSGQRSQLNALIADLHTIVEAAERQLPGLNTGLAWTGPTFQHLAEVGSAGPWFDIVAYGLGCLDAATLLQTAAGACAGT